MEVQVMALFQSKYGYFNDLGNEYIITRPDTPRPWVNVICPGDYGVVVSQTGSGYSWKTHASHNRITRWEQDLIKDNSGKYLYLRDEDTGEFWSLTWKPVCSQPDFYRVHHGIGYSRFFSTYQDLESTLTIFVPPAEPVEIWKVRFQNNGPQVKRLSLFTYVEWCLGLPDPAREFHRVFCETQFNGNLNTIFARKRLWEIPNAKGQHWNRDWEYVAFHSVNMPVAGYEGDKEMFLGPYGVIEKPAAVVKGTVTGTTGKWSDPIGSLHNRIELSPGQDVEIIYLLGAVAQEQQEQATAIINKYQSSDAVEEAFTATKAFWNQQLSTTTVTTPDPGFNLMNNIWLKYQTLSCHLWGRTSYYQAGGAYGFRDQLQASQLLLYIDPTKTEEQIKLNAAHQFPEGWVNHWWHPLSELAAENYISDNRLWLPFVVIKYLKETGNFAFLDEQVPYKNGVKARIYDHCCQALNYSLAHLSPQGLPLIGDGDWNDGMNAVGADGKGVSIWLAQFLSGLLKEFAVVVEKSGDLELEADYLDQAERLQTLINTSCWDGDWYIRAICDDGTILGSKNSPAGKIFLNPQSWAILYDIAPPERREKLFQAMEKYLFRPYGPILFYPSYKSPQPQIGYLSRYAPGLRENGGTYTHAATWGVLAACKLGKNNQAYAAYKSFLPPYRGLDPDLYKAEPYVNPGNVDGPDSPNFGRGGFSWYTGSSAWSFLTALEGICGIIPDWDSLIIKPMVPDDWNKFTVTRPYRGASYQFNFRRATGGEETGISVDGVKIDSNRVFPHHDGAVHQVEVIF
jgi:cellobiose phosphorylase